MKYILKHLCQVFRAKVNLIMIYDVCVATIIFSANDQLPFYTKAVWRETNKGLLEKFITRHFQTVPKVYRPVYNMFRFMKIVIKVIFTAYKPLSSFSEIRLARNRKCLSNIEFRTATHLVLPFRFPVLTLYLTTNIYSRSPQQY